MAKGLFFLVVFLSAVSVSLSADDLFSDLELTHKIDEDLSDHLPVYYNSSMMGGYFSMPSARMAEEGVAAFGVALAKPYNIYGLNFQTFDRLELALNYRVYRDVLEGNFGREGFGDDAERIANVKVGVLTKRDGFPRLPELSLGIEDFVGTKRFNSTYVVATEQFLSWNGECTLGWGKGRIRGFFGALSWTPWHHSSLPLLNGLSLMAEYDATNYKKHRYEHPKGRTVKSRVNGGLSLLAWDRLQLSVNSLRGTEIAAEGSLRYPIGTTGGLFAKTEDPLPYQSPTNTEPLGVIRKERDFATEIAYALGDQGLDLYEAKLSYDEKGRSELFLRIINNRYREEKIVRERIEHVLASLLPDNIDLCTVVIEADALLCHSYHFRKEDLQRWKKNQLSDFELATLSSMKEATSLPNSYEAAELFRRRKPIWSLTARPRLMTFFGSTTGKIKYNLSALLSPEGYLFDHLYYKVQGSYSIASSMQNLGGADRLNPSRELIVRTDTLKYFQRNSFSLEQAFFQRSWNLSKGVFSRLALGFFEPAYGGGATELLYYPVGSSFAVGVEGAVVWKREYHGVKLRRSTWKLEGNCYRKVPFLGVQYFLDLYYDFKPLNLDFLVTAGQFLAKDKGARLEVGKYFKSGLRFSLWCTWTNGHDRVNGHTYFDKGFSFMIPLDFFLKESSRKYIGYAMSAWLRDVGAQADTGKKLYWTLQKERYVY